MDAISVALIQQSFSDSTESNKRLCEYAIRQAAARDAKLIVLPELHNSVYFCQTEDAAIFDLAEPIPGPTSQWLAALAAELKLVIVGSVFERRAPGLYHNTAIVADQDQGVIGLYRKMHLPDDPGYYEKYYFTPGDQGFQPIATSIGRLGVLICWDQWFPEAARMMALAGAELLLYPSAIGWDPRDDKKDQQQQLDAWKIIQRGHAIANGIPLLSCNRFGIEADPSGQSKGILFWGNSFICGPFGEMIAEANDCQSSLLQAELNLKKNEDIRRIWPFLRDRRIDAYQALSCRIIEP